ncbi:MAG: protein kinase domain-containing protein [Microcoleaceae cyanobacterium]
MTVIPTDSKTEVKLQNGKYILHSLLHRSEFELVYQGVCLLQGQPVVIKTLNPQLRHRPDFAQLHFHFKAIAQRISRCRHPHLAKVLEVFEDRGLPFVVLEKISGQTLEDSLQNQSPMAVHQATAIVKQIASALGAIHRQGVLHCALCPRVVMKWPKAQHMVLTGFGLVSELIQGSDQSPIRHRSLLGGYAAIEQYLPHEPLSPATDIYSLAAIFYTLLVGKPPLEAPLLVSQATRTLLSQSKPSLQSLHPSLSPAVERLIFWGLELEQQHRPQTVEQWLSLFPQLPDLTPDLESESGKAAFPQAVNLKVNLESVAGATNPVSALEPIFQQPSTDQTHSGLKQDFPAQLVQIPQSWKMVLGLFVFTALFSGWLGFAFTRFYSRTLAPKAILSRQSIGDRLPNYDPSKPMFEDPSVIRQRNRPLFRFQGERDFDHGNRDNPEPEAGQDDLGKDPENTPNVDVSPSTLAEPESLETSKDSTAPSSPDLPERPDSTLELETPESLDPTPVEETRNIRPARDLYSPDALYPLRDLTPEDLPPLPQGNQTPDRAEPLPEPDVISAPNQFEYDPSELPQKLPPIPLPNPSDYNPNPELYIPNDPDSLPPADTPGRSSNWEYQKDVQPLDSTS